MPLYLRKKTVEKKPNLQEKIVGRTTSVVHLTHNDLDAAGSDAICRMAFGPEILTLFSSVNRFGWFVGQVEGMQRQRGSSDHLGSWVSERN